MCGVGNDRLVWGRQVEKGGRKGVGVVGGWFRDDYIVCAHLFFLLGFLTKPIRLAQIEETMAKVHSMKESDGEKENEKEEN